MQRDNQFGSWLRECRKALDVTRAELASQIGCAVITVKKIETTAQRPSKQMAERLANVLSIAPSELAAFVAFARGLSATPPAVPLLRTAARLADHLPSPPTPFVGRSEELVLLRQRLDNPNCRLLTLVGPGGIGKTRLAVEAAHTHRANFVHGAHFVSLALVNSPDEFVFAIGNVLEFSFDGQQAPIVQLINYVRDKRLLLVLDGFEHLLGAVPLLVNLLAGAPQLKLVITSRERLNLQGEWALLIEGMDYPRGTDHDHFERYSAVQLFVQAARQSQPGFSLTSDAPGVLHICQLVEGIPLAIELAAAWVRLLSCAHIAERLASSLDFLTSPVRNAPERHRSLRVVFDHSWVLLSSIEQTALAKLSVLRGSFDLEAAEAVGGATLLVVASLVDKSLLRVDGARRYALHELLRQYAAEQLAHQADGIDHRKRAIDYLTHAAERASGAAAHRQASALLGQAIAMAEEIDQSDVLGELHHRRAQALLKVSLWIEARPDLEAALSATGSGTIDRRVQILLELADVSFYLHDLTGQRRCVEEALVLADTAKRSDLAAAAMIKQGYAETNDGNLTQAVGLYERAIALGGSAHYDLGRTLYWHGRYSDALSHLRQAVALNQNDPIEQIWPLEDLGLVLSATGHYAEAVRVFDQARRLSREYEVWPAQARSVANLAGLHLDVFDFAGNEALAEEARELARSADFVLTEVSAGLDLLLNFARRHEPWRAEKLMPEVAAAVEKAGGSHGWLWRLRLVQAQAELALARREWDEAVQLAEISIQESRDRGRIKYLTLSLKTRAQALAALGRTHEAIVDLRNALDVARPTGDPALFLSVAAVLLSIESDDALAGDASSAVQRIRAALPNNEMRRSFDAAEPVQTIAAFGS
jgi:predicted ATPase/DNA-binding XRE family transcriptional regulator